MAEPDRNLTVKHKVCWRFHSIVPVVPIPICLCHLLFPAQYLSTVLNALPVHGSQTTFLTPYRVWDNFGSPCLSIFRWFNLEECFATYYKSIRYQIYYKLKMIKSYSYIFSYYRLCFKLTTSLVFWNVCILPLVLRLKLPFYQDFFKFLFLICF